jgi:hypothetical protein
MARVVVMTAGCWGGGAGWRRVPVVGQRMLWSSSWRKVGRKGAAIFVAIANI